jgi:hypothetical protein
LLVSDFNAISACPHCVRVNLEVALVLASNDRDRRLATAFR